MKEKRIKLALQKKGRLSEASLALLRQCGIRVHNGGKLKASAGNFPLDVLFLRDDDIPQYVEDGVADIGVVGENVQLEKGGRNQVIERLGFGKCRLSIAVQRETVYEGLGSLNNCRIATSYPRILNNYLKKQGVSAQIEEISGSVEIAPGIGLAEAICDVVSTGSTLLTNGLKEVEVILQSEAVLIGASDFPNDKLSIVNDLKFRIQSVLGAQQHKYILLNAPNESLEQIKRILPGMRSPTILPLAQSGWSSLHSVIHEDTFWENIDEIKRCGAEGILVCPIEKMIL